MEITLQDDDGEGADRTGGVASLPVLVAPDLSPIISPDNNLILIP